MSDIGPFGTYSFSVTDGYTDTSSLPLGLEKAANLLQPESENEKWCRRTRSQRKSERGKNFIQ